MQRPNPAEMPVDLDVTDAPDESVRRVIQDGLSSHNEEQAGYADARPLAVVVRDGESRRPIGGVLGRTSFGLLFIDLVFLPKELRGRDLGSRVLLTAETEAKRRGCSSAVLYTISFQAPGFYERHGWREFGRIACDPPGTSRVFMTKALTDDRAVAETLV